MLMYLISIYFESLLCAMHWRRIIEKNQLLMFAVNKVTVSYEPQKLMQEIGHIMKIVTILLYEECYGNLLERASCKKFCRVTLVIPN